MERIIEAIASDGYVVSHDYLPEKTLQALSNKIKNLKESELQPAGIGRGVTQQHNEAIRQDKIKWLDSDNKVDAVFLAYMELLRKRLNASLFLGLFDFEAHYAVYQKNTFYKKHRDALVGKSNRVLSVVVYLNSKWHDGDGGELILYNQQETEIIENIKPKLATTVIFLSEKFPHEVSVAKNTRYSIAGWFRINASSSTIVDTIK